MSRKTFDINEDVGLTATFRDPDTDELVDPATVTCTVEKPRSLGNLTPAVSNVSAGVYRATVTPAEGEHGKWWYRFNASGDVRAAQERFFVVRKQAVG